MNVSWEPKQIYPRSDLHDAFIEPPLLLPAELFQLECVFQFQSCQDIARCWEYLVLCYDSASLKTLNEHALDQDIHPIWMCWANCVSNLLQIDEFAPYLKVTLDGVQILLGMRMTLGRNSRKGVQIKPRLGLESEEKMARPISNNSTMKTQCARSMRTLSSTLPR